MAPKGGRGGGGGRGGSSISACPGAFSDTFDAVFFANSVLLFAAFLGISIALCSARKKSGAGKKLIGAPFIVAVWFFIISYILDIVTTVLIQCNRYVEFDTIIGLVITENVFLLLAYWLTLFVVVYTLNSMLREHLGGITVIYKVIYIAILGLVFALTVGYMGLSNYNVWAGSAAGEASGARRIIRPTEQLRVAYYVFYFLSVFASAALSLMAVVTMKSRKLPGGGLLPWIIALYIFLVIRVLMGVLFASMALQDEPYSLESQAAMAYIQTFAHVFVFIALLCIAKHAAWSKAAAGAIATDTSTAYAPVAQQQPVYGYNAPAGQQYYYQQQPGVVYNQQQAPVYNPAPMNGVK